MNHGYGIYEKHAWFWKVGYLWEMAIGVFGFKVQHGLKGLRVGDRHYAK